MSPRQCKYSKPDLSYIYDETTSSETFTGSGTIGFQHLHMSPRHYKNSNGSAPFRPAPDFFTNWNYRIIDQYRLYVFQMSPRHYYLNFAYSTRPAVKSMRLLSLWPQHRHNGRRCLHFEFGGFEVDHRSNASPAPRWYAALAATCSPGASFLLWTGQQRPELLSLPTFSATGNLFLRFSTDLLWQLPLSPLFRRPTPASVTGVESGAEDAHPVQTQATWWVKVPWSYRVSSDIVTY